MLRRERRARMVGDEGDIDTARLAARQQIMLARV
jgi:hypothetical protein